MLLSERNLVKSLKENLVPDGDVIRIVKIGQKSFANYSEKTVEKLIAKLIAESINQISTGLIQFFYYCAVVSKMEVTDKSPRRCLPFRFALPAGLEPATVDLRGTLLFPVELWEPQNKSRKLAIASGSFNSDHSKLTFNWI